MKETSKQVLDGGTLMHKVWWENDIIGTVEFILIEETKVKANQEAFFSNEKDKAKFIKMLSKFLITD